MKCMIFIFTICSIGTFIDVQGETDGEESSDLELTRYSEDENNDSSETSNSREAVEELFIDGNGNLKDKNKNSKQLDKETMRLFMNEVAAGDMADLVGQNQHIQQSSEYRDLGRRSEPQALKNNVAENPDYLTPEKAPPELVLLVAKESMLLRAGKDNDLNDFDQNKILRSGNYWDGAWKEEIIPKSTLRSQEKQLGSIKAKINPGTEFYKVVSRMKKISPKLLYIINKK